jgi:histidine triad (HIT) family protein
LSTQTPQTNANCPFCVWLKGEGKQPPTVYEDEHLVATLCESPITPGHVQIIHKTHYSELAVVDTDDSARMGALIPLLSAAIKNGLGAEMIYVACISEEVRHVHFHLVPRFRHDTKGFGLFTGQRIALENVDETVAAIKSHIPVKANS